MRRPLYFATLFEMAPRLNRRCHLLNPFKHDRKGVLELLTLLCWEAAFAVAYETWIGPTYINGLAGELGLDLKWVAFLAAVPWLGALGQIAGPWAL